MTKSVVCIDFDGTIVNVNTFPLWVKFVLKKAWRSKAFSILFRMCFLLLLRKGFGVLSHSDFKKNINSMNYPADWAENFFIEMQNYGYFNHKVSNKIESLDAYSYVVTTAAPYCYAKMIPKYFLFNGQSPLLLCSKSHGDHFLDNFKEAKAKNTQDCIDGQGYILFTDHIDDLALARDATELYLCNPDQKSLSTFDSFGFDYKMIQGG